MAQPTPDELADRIEHTYQTVLRYAADIAAGVSPRTAALRAFGDDRDPEDALRESAEIARREQAVHGVDGFYDVTVAYDPLAVTWRASGTLDRNFTEVTADTWEEAVLSFLRTRLAHSNQGTAPSERVIARLAASETRTAEELQRQRRLADLADLDDVEPIESSIDAVRHRLDDILDDLKSLLGDLSAPQLRDLKESLDGIVRLLDERSEPPAS